MKTSKPSKILVLFYRDGRLYKMELDGERNSIKQVGNNLSILHGAHSESRAYWEQSAPGMTELRIEFYN
jgi:hypothetical protein